MKFPDVLFPAIELLGILGITAVVLVRGISRSAAAAVGVALLTRAVSVVVAAVVLHRQLAGISFGSYLFTSTSGYFRDQVRHSVILELAALLAAVVFGLFLTLVRTRRPAVLVSGEAILVGALVLTLGWPTMVLGILATFLVAVVLSIAAATRARTLGQRIRLSLAATLGCAGVAVLSAVAPIATLVAPLLI